MNQDESSKENLEMFKENLESLDIKISGEISFLMNQNKDIKKTMEGLKSPSLGTNKEPFISRSELTELKTTLDTNMEKMMAVTNGLKTDVDAYIQKVMDDKLEGQDTKIKESLRSSNLASNLAAENIQELQSDLSSINEKLNNIPDKANINTETQRIVDKSLQPMKNLGATLHCTAPQQILKMKM